MRANEDTVLVGRACSLVPYRKEHVETYHQWMLSPELQELTASEPLSLEEEFAMQVSWRDDKDKLTFIILDHTGPPGAGEPPVPACCSAVCGHAGGAMCGDVNLFFNDHDDEKTAEIDVMVAVPSSRRKGIAREAVRMMMAYAAADLRTRRFVAKVKSGNEPSLALFRSLGYAEVRRLDWADEIHLALPAGDPADTPADGVLLESVRQTAAEMTRASYSGAG
ncbi:unnamed protein product [Pedinophyceae sp. YPF-701]|nr:unnamed protein product [Pedinophyceae sp. YPF-701]